MKYTINGYSQEKLLKNNLDLSDSLILRVLADIYSSNSKKIEYKIMNNDKYMWISYGYLFEQIPVIGSERTLVRKIDNLIEKGMLKKELVTSKKGIKGRFLYVSFGEKYFELTEYSNNVNKKIEVKEKEDKVKKSNNSLSSENTKCQIDTDQMTKCHEPNDKLTSYQMTKCHNKDSSIDNTSINNNILNNTYVKNEFSRVCEEIKNNWIKIAHEYKLSGTQLKITEKRKRVINNLLKEYSAEEVLQAMKKVHTSSFLQGNNKTGWQISFDWFINKSNFLKVLEGNYDDKVNSEIKNNNTHTNQKPGASAKTERPKVTAEGLRKYFGGSRNDNGGI